MTRSPQSHFAAKSRALWSSLALFLGVALVFGACSGSDSDAGNAPTGSDTAHSSVSADAQDDASTQASDPATPGVGVGDELEPFYEQHVRWYECGDLECAIFHVPFDYENPAGDTIGLSIMRLPARSAEAQGTLFLNPGGPGAEVTPLISAADSYPKKLRNHYDLVAFDARGVGSNDSVTCVTGKDLGKFQRYQGPPTKNTSLKRIRSVNANFGQECAENTGDLLEQVSTFDHARDMDIARAVLGEEKLNYLGYSYGTVVGSVYGSLFPERVGRFVFDGAANPFLDWQGFTQAQALGFEKAFERFLVDCHQQSYCPFPESQKAAKKKVTDLMKQVGKKKLATDKGEVSRKMNQADLVTGTIAMLYHEGMWPTLRHAYDAAFNGDGTIFVLESNDLYGLDSQGRALNQSQAGYRAYVCADQNFPQGEAGEKAIEKLAKQLQKQAPIFGAAVAWEHLACTTWPAANPAEQTLPLAPIAQMPPVLIVNSQYDAPTPLKQAKQVVNKIPGSILVELKGSATHTSYPGTSKCVDKVVNRYLLKGQLPTKNMICKK